MNLNTILEIKNLSIQYGNTSALQDVSLTLLSKRAYAIVGGSGSGKSTLAYAILGILKDRGGKITQGTIQFPQEKVISQFTPGRVAYIPQDPHNAFDPLFTIRSHFEETLDVNHPHLNYQDREILIQELLKQVELNFQLKDLNRYPHEFSGGEKQRLLIALALSGNPYLVIADEPTSSLDVTVQAEIIQLFKKIIQKKSTSLLFITHHLLLAKQLCIQTTVFNQGKTVEFGETQHLFKYPHDVYTKALIEAIPGKLHET